MTNRPGARSRLREFDLVLWGATGFVGRLAAEYLVRGYHGREGGVRLALAGRSRLKLQQLAKQLGAPELCILVGDSFDGPSLDALAAKTAVLMSTVGPYARYGAEAVAACVRNRTDYCDLTGETQFVQAMIEAHHEDAKRAGTRIVHSCGYDSIPSDLGTLMVQDAFKRRHGKYASEVKLAAGEMRGGFSGGTLASITNFIDEAKANPSLGEAMRQPYALNPEGIRGPDRGDQSGVRFDRDLCMWTGPFPMAAITSRIVRRSHALCGLPWGQDFRYSEVTGTGKGAKGWASAAVLAGGMAAFMRGIASPLVRPLLQRRLPQPGEGPSEEARARGFFNTRLLALGGGQAVRGLVADRRDPGYGSTAVMLSETALCLALDGAALESGGGSLTPASAMGMHLVDRLRAAGMTFDVQN